jgi:predicted nucleic acid-binding protein
MNVLIDTNVILDYLLKRWPHEKEASRILLMSEKALIDAYISASAATDIFYIVKKDFQDKSKTYAVMHVLFSMVKIAAVDDVVIRDSLALEWDDFEDCVQYLAAKDFQADYIITRDTDGFRNSTIKVVSPDDFVAMIDTDVWIWNT